MAVVAVALVIVVLTVAGLIVDFTFVTRLGELGTGQGTAADAERLGELGHYLAAADAVRALLALLCLPLLYGLLKRRNWTRVTLVLVLTFYAVATIIAGGATALLLVLLMVIGTISLGLIALLSGEVHGREALEGVMTFGFASIAVDILVLVLVLTCLTLALARSCRHHMRNS